ncbi:cilia- and flagella-associated protein 99-like isoform X2 [Limulus polyphemus]|uniref:Cilia- and flagella-associated protein 99-like isoform X2 n=1 Tax=Limulus polyphemus TaxID=6850 RepID=A0ABM1T6E0_LIMPO|nr:cilia- and flagella-associated protein 99-like isoform X2 [Limulus polyphemus]
MSSCPVKLFDNLVDFISDYNPSYDINVEEYIVAKTANETLDEKGLNVLKQLFVEFLHYEKIFSTVTKEFYATVGRNVKAINEELFKVICYLVLFRLENIGIQQLKKFILQKNSRSVKKFLTFLLDENVIKESLLPKWYRVYDLAFVSCFVKKFIRWLPALKDDVLDQIISEKPKERYVKPATEPQPYKLSESNAKNAVSLREKTKDQQKDEITIKAIPVPKSTYQSPSISVKISQQKLKNKEKGMALLEKATTEMPRCAEIMKPVYCPPAENLEKVEKGKKFAWNPVPKETLSSVPVRRTWASILREGSVFQKKEEQDFKFLAALEAGARDLSQHQQYVEKKRQKELEEELAYIECQRLDGLLSYQEAIRARQNLVEEKRRLVKQVKAETEEKLRIYLQEKIQTKKKLRQLVEEILQGKDKTKRAQEKLKNYKKKIVQQMTKENQELMKRAFEEMEKELQQKAQLIKEIRAMEACSLIRQPKVVDPTQTSGMGFLTEMSLFELRKKLSKLKLIQQKELEEKMAMIQETREARHKILEETLETICRQRELQRLQDQVSKIAEKEQNRKVSKMKVESQEIKELRQRLEECRAHRLGYSTEQRTQDSQ